MGAREISLSPTANAIASYSRQADLKAVDSILQAANAQAVTGFAGMPKSLVETKVQDLSAAGRSALADLARYVLPVSSLLELASVARYRVHPRGTSTLIRRTSGHVLFLIDGCALEETTDSQTVRLWRSGAVFGEQPIVHGFSPGSSRTNETRYLNFLSESRCLLIPRDKLRTLALSDPMTMLMISRIGMDRTNVIERLYTVTRKAPVSRVATLLDYLAGETTVMRPKTVENEEKQLVVKPMRNAIVEGPTQNDISEALTLGRATVERALGELRREGALLRFRKGERTNRVYEIADRDLLQQIARGG
ncbi:Crp/Fnr family transcriptional regulator [Streptomyces sp. NPDC050564]|uniref:Crp/Fnr family transcriptional regulator n=1 Tax=Streptomyces sp. NPDC050564 TaxID=3365631 RepID=UPI0037954A2E